MNMQYAFSYLGGHFPLPFPYCPLGDGVPYQPIHSTRNISLVRHALFTLTLLLKRIPPVLPDLSLATAEILGEGVLLRVPMHDLRLLEATG